MSYATLLVHLELGKSNADMLNIAGDLAERCQASVIGIAACQPLQFAYGGVYISGELVEQHRAEMEREASEAETEFQMLLESRAAQLAWRCGMTDEPLAGYVAREARSADLLITATDRGSSLLGNSQHVNMGELVMGAGRPVLLVPTGAAKLQSQRMLVAWKDSRETRRAALDALPLLKMAAHVSIVEIAPEDEMADAAKRLDDVVGWLKRHGIAAAPLVSRSTGNDAMDLANIAGRQSIDIVVAGAYGHSRLHEWVLGGVTTDLLLGTNRCSLLSH